MEFLVPHLTKIQWNPTLCSPLDYRWILARFLLWTIMVKLKYIVSILIEHEVANIVLNDKLRLRKVEKWNSRFLMRGTVVRKISSSRNEVFASFQRYAFLLEIGHGKILLCLSEHETQMFSRKSSYFKSMLWYSVQFSWLFPFLSDTHHAFHATVHQISQKK